MTEAARARRGESATDRAPAPSWPLAPAPRPPGIAASDWEDWGWQMRHRIRSAADLRAFLEPTADESAAIEALAKRFRFVITPYYASLMDPADPDCPVRRQVVPRLAELDDPAGLADPLGEVSHSPVKNVIRVYPDRIAFCVNNECALYCRYCLRKRMVGDEDWTMQKRELEVALDWIAKTPEIRDVLLTGGDPLVYSDAKLEWLLGRLRAIPHVELIRLGTRLPVTLPFPGDRCALPDARALPSDLGQHAFQSSARADGGGGGGLRSALAGGDPGREPERAAARHQRFAAGHADALRDPGAHARAALLRLPGPAARGHGAFPRADRGRAGDFSAGCAAGRAASRFPSTFSTPPHGKVPLELPFVKGRDGDDYVVEAWDGAIWREPNPRG
jgi:lysine 2,3-aminomutase